MSDELRARATWLPPWGSCHGGAVTERAVPVRGIDCIGKTAQRSASRWDDYSTCCPALQGVRARRPGAR